MPPGDPWQRMASLYEQVAEQVAGAHSIPLVVFGDCTTSLGVLAGLQLVCSVADWTAKASRSEIQALLEVRPTIPKELDALLLQQAVRTLAVPTIADEDRQAMRRAFWSAIETLLAS